MAIDFRDAPPPPTPPKKVPQPSKNDAKTPGDILSRRRGRPTVDEQPHTFEATKPWLAGEKKMARSTWYRRRSLEKAKVK